MAAEAARQSKRPKMACEHAREGPELAALLTRLTAVKSTRCILQHALLDCIGRVGSAAFSSGEGNQACACLVAGKSNPLPALQAVNAAVLLRWQVGTQLWCKVPGYSVWPVVAWTMLLCPKGDWPDLIESYQPGAQLFVSQSQPGLLQLRVNVLHVMHDALCLWGCCRRGANCPCAPGSVTKSWTHASCSDVVVQGTCWSGVMQNTHTHTHTHSSTHPT